jgi:hypothetical protein
MWYSKDTCPTIDNLRNAFLDAPLVSDKSKYIVIESTLLDTG